jgi:hypothetical protein
MTKELDVWKLTRQMKIVHFEFLEQGRTMNQHCCLEILARLHEAVRRRRPESWPDAWILHHDNTLAMIILQSIPKEEFQKCFEQCKHRLTKCIGAQGDYFEGESNH